MKIIPAILAHNLVEFDEKLAAASFAPEIQIDIADGVFVDTTTIQLADLAELPQEQRCEIHFMVADPLRYLNDCVRLKIDRVAIHAEIEWDMAGIVRKFQEAGMKVVIALNPETSIEKLRGLLADIDGVLIMSVHPGASGQDFIPDVLAKASLIRTENPDMVLEIDGGVNVATIAQVAAAGFDVAAVGSGIFSTDDPKATFDELQAMVK